MQKQFVIIGIGRFGSSLARTLTNMGYDVLAIDRKPRKGAELYQRRSLMWWRADATDP